MPVDVRCGGFMTQRAAHVTRETKESRIAVDLVLDGRGGCSIQTGFGFADHMLELMAHWAGFDLSVSCVGDLHINVRITPEMWACVWVGLCKMRWETVAGLPG